MNAAVLVGVLFCVGVILLPPARWAVLGIFLAVCYVTQHQNVVFWEFHFTAIRIALLAGLARVLARGEFKQFKPNAIDKAVLAYTTAQVFIYTLRIGTSEALVFMLGTAYDILLSYFVLRCLMPRASDVLDALPAMALLIVPLAAFMCWEALGARNVFSIFGAFEHGPIREGHLRCMGPFRSPITVGSFGAAFGVLYLALWWNGFRRRTSFIGLLASLAILFTAHSSGPLLAAAGGVVALAFWRLRERMRAVRWGIGLALLGLHLVMKAPVWFLITRVSDLVGGGGYHRAALIDQFVNRFGSWVLLGASDTGDWMATQLEDGTADLTNAFVAAGVTAGMIGLVLFVSIFVKTFQRLGRGRKAAADAGAMETEWLIWAFGAVLFAHALNLISVTYFDQMRSAWYMFLAMASAIGQESGVETPDGLQEYSTSEGPLDGKVYAALSSRYCLGAD